MFTVLNFILKWLLPFGIASSTFLLLTAFLEDKYKKSHTGHPIYKVSFQKEVTQMLLTILIVCAVLLALLCVYALLRSAAQADAITQQIQETLVKK